MPLAHEELTYAIIGAAIEVHRELGPGFVERIYHNALCIELSHRGHLVRSRGPSCRSPSSYLRAMDLEHGLILNFGKTPLEIRRVTTAIV